MNEKEKDEYIECLENLLIFMCQIYDETQKILLDLATTERNDAYMKVPIIQGIMAPSMIHQIGELDFKQPKNGFLQARDIMVNKRK